MELSDIFIETIAELRQTPSDDCYDLIGELFEKINPEELIEISKHIV